MGVFILLILSPVRYRRWVNSVGLTWNLVYSVWDFVELSQRRGAEGSYQIRYSHISYGE